MSRSLRRVALALLAAPLVAFAAARADVLLRDDFSAAAVDTGTWHQPEGCGTYFGRTQIRPPAFPLAAVDGALALLVDAYNPTGFSFWGSELVSNAAFTPPDDGVLRVRARVRLVDPTSSGFDASLFLYRILPPATACDANPPRDEIDFELLTSQIGSGQVLTNVFAAEAIGGAGAPLYPVVAGFDPRAWHELELRWSRAAIEWRVDGALVRTETDHLPAGPLAVRLNFWAPASDFPQAYASPPDPTASPESDAEWRYEVDFVEVSAPECDALAAGVSALGALAARARRAARRGSRRCSTRSRVQSTAPGRPRGR